MKNKRVPQLDGIRCLAITLVVASHSGFLLQGGLGNNIFFALSGFFAVAPFVHDAEKRYASVKGIGNYYLKRFFRIVPVFWFYLLFATFLFPGVYYIARELHTDQSLLKNMFFINNRGHLWFLQQEVLFSIICPVILLIIYGIRCLARKLISSEVIIELILAGVLLCGAILSLKFLTVDVFYTYGNGGKQFFRLGFFLIGMTTGYLYKAYDSSQQKWGTNALYRSLANLYILCFLAFCILSSEPILSRFDPRFDDYFIGWTKPLLCVVLTCVAIFVLATSENSLANRFIGNRFFCYVGKISFSMYLFHWVFISPFRNEYPVRSFLLIYFLSICVAGVVYQFVEQPMTNFRVQDIWNKITTKERTSV